MELKKAYLPLVRKHVDSHRWGYEAGTDFWLVPNPGLDIGIADSDTDPGAQNGLPAHGWTATSLVNTAGSGADFGSSADKGTPNHLLTNADADLLDSPAIFGDYQHMWQAMRVAGIADLLPRYLVAEFMGAMTVHSADEQDSGWGFIEDGGSPATAADAIAMIATNGTNFLLTGGAADLEIGAADDANWHVFKIVISRENGWLEWYIDGTSQGRTADDTVTADEFPCSFGFAAGTTNRPALGIAHVYYDW